MYTNFETRYLQSICLIYLGTHCPPFETSEIIEQSAESTGAGDVITFWCSHGYKSDLVDAYYFTSECTLEGVWSHDMPTCSSKYRESETLQL